MFRIPHYFSTEVSLFLNFYLQPNFTLYTALKAY